MASKSTGNSLQGFLKKTKEDTETEEQQAILKEKVQQYKSSRRDIAISKTKYKQFNFFLVVGYLAYLLVLVY